MTLYPSSLRTLCGVLLAAASLILWGCSSDSSTPATDGDQETVVDGDETPELELEETTQPEVEVEVEGEAEAEAEAEAVSENILPFEAAGPGTAAPDPMALGPFPVGVRTVILTDNDRVYNDGSHKGQPRKIITEIWYPAVQSARGQAGAVYNISDEVPDYVPEEKKQLVFESNLPGITTAAVRDAAPDGEHGPYPVVIFSHGANGIRWQSIFYTIHLASHGYIVVSPDHEYNTVWDLFVDGYDVNGITKNLFPRIYDAQYLIDRMEAYEADPSHYLYHLIDLDNIAISGHSFGGLVSVGLPCIDPRVKVSVPHAPVIGVTTALGCDLDNYDVPIMVMGGTKDDTLPFWQQYCDYNIIHNTEKWLYMLDRGGHFTFSDICDLDLVTLADKLDIGNAEDALNDGCSPTENVNYQDAHNTINYYATAFLNFYLRGNEASEALLQDYSEYPFDSVTLYSGQAPDWPNGCEEENN